MKVDKVLNSFISGYLTKSRYYADDPTVLGFNLFFQKDFNSPLLNRSEFGESAMRYLISIGEPERADHLKDFIRRLTELVEDHPYFIQQMSGLGNIYKLESGKPFNDGRILEFETLESLDLRIASLVDSYIKATFDIENHRKMIPENLLEFSFIIIISEIRNFRSFIEGVDSSEGKYIDLNKNLGTFIYKFDRSLFNFEDSNGFLNSISNADLKSVSNSFKIKCGKMFDYSNVRIFDALLKNYEPPLKIQDMKINQIDKSNPENEEILKNPDKIEKKNNNFLTNQTGQIKQKFDEFVDNKFAQVVLGNALFRSVEPNIIGLATGDQTLNDINPLTGRTLGSSSKLVVKNIFTDDKILKNETDQERKEREIRDTLNRGLIPNLENPIQSLKEKILISTLGNALKGLL
jgi:hypothetical protein